MIQWDSLFSNTKEKKKDVEDDEEGNSDGDFSLDRD